ncbi:hypothetical protein [Streptomyces antnestii]|uniref:hypothetical protein n=1 Tax=Streptomyces antnestii TaxID=2494256 RepID=UPI003D670F1C
MHRVAGFLNGWNAFVFLLATSAAELNALGLYVQYWFRPSPPPRPPHCAHRPHDLAGRAPGLRAL